MDPDDHPARFAEAFELAGELAIPKGPEGAVFAAPWEGQAFAVAVELHEEGRFTWQEFAACLSSEIARSGNSPEGNSPDGSAPDGSDYYLHWLRACEKLMADKGLLHADEIARRAAEIAASRHHHKAPGR